jgi:hypothetical protein
VGDYEGDGQLSTNIRGVAQRHEVLSHVPDYLGLAIANKGAM